MNKKTLILYIVFIHSFLALTIVKSDFIQRVQAKFGMKTKELTEHYRNMTTFHSRIDKNLSRQSILFIGDSHIQGLAVGAITKNAANFGIGNDTTKGVLKRIPDYRSISSSKAIVLAIGFNDLRYRENSEILDNLNAILKLIPTHVTVILCAVHPVGEKRPGFNNRIKILNDSFRELSVKYSNVNYLNTFESYLSSENYLPSKYLLSDNIHLSPKGYSVWMSELSTIISKIKDK